MAEEAGPAVTNVNQTSTLAQLRTQYGPLIGGDHLRKILAYPSSEAFRLAVLRKKCPVPVFAIENRRGNFSLVEDVAAWLDNQRAAAAKAAKTMAAKENDVAT